MSLIILASAALAGIVVGSLWHVEPARLVGASGVAALGACLGWPQPRWRMLALVACAAALGAMRGSMAPVSQPSDALEPYLGQRVRLRAHVAEVPKLVGGGAYARLLLGVEALGPAGTGKNAAPPQPSSPGPAARVPPQVLVLAEPATRVAGLNLGERVTVEGRLAAAADARGPPVLWAAQVVDEQPPAGNAAPGEPDNATAAGPGPSPVSAALGALGSMRQAAAANVLRYLPEPQASLAVGILLGGSGHLSPGFKLELQRSGLTHLLAIDGYKEALVAALATALAVRLFGVRVALLTTVVLIGGYTLLTGAHPSAVRAALMLGLASLATLSGRVADPLTSLSVVVLALAVVEPPLLFDVGLQLSVSATLGIILLWPRLRRRLHRLPRWIAEPLGLSAAVTLATLPVTLSTFQFVSLVSPIAHVAAIPLLPLVLVSTLVLAALAALPPLNELPATLAGLSQLPSPVLIAAWLAWLPTTLLLWVVHVFGSLPAAGTSTGRLPPAAALTLAAALLSYGVWQVPELTNLRRAARRWHSNHAKLLAPVALAAACIAAATLLGLMRPDGQVHLQSLRLSHGQAVFIRGPSGVTALVVRGQASATSLATEVARNLAVWEHQLNLVVALDDGAQTALAETLERYPADELISNSDSQTPLRLKIGRGAAVDVWSAGGQLRVAIDATTSGPTTSAARPGAAN